MARYINEDEFVAWVKEHWCSDCQNDNGLRCRACWIDDAIDIVEEVPEADVAPRAEWISVAERVPDCEYGAETEALLFRLKTGTVEAGYFGTGGRFRDKYFRCYHHANEGWDAKDVTHWMPLPEPPEPTKGD